MGDRWVMHLDKGVMEFWGDGFYSVIALATQTPAGVWIA